MTIYSLIRLSGNMKTRDLYPGEFEVFLTSTLPAHLHKSQFATLP